MFPLAKSSNSDRYFSFLSLFSLFSFLEWDSVFDFSPGSVVVDFELVFEDETVITGPQVCQNKSVHFIE